STPCPVTGQPMPSVLDPNAPVQPGTVGQPPPDQTAADVRPDFGGRGGGGGVGPSGGRNGYIENAAPTTMVRVRFDSGYGNNRPDRGNFFYAKCGCFRPQRDAIGVPLPEKNIDYQDLISSVEYAFTPRFSAFADVPVRFLNPDANANATGIGDVSFGAKYAFIYNPNRIVSLFLRFQAPAGSISQGLGDGQWFVEPGLLYLEQLSPLWQVFGELRFTTPLGKRTDFTGNMIRYGIGTSYIVAQGRWGYVAPVLELVGWNVLSGKELDPDALAAVSAAGDTIVNAKFGLRVGFGNPVVGSPYPTRSDLYIGYGRALTGEVWYKDLLRVEFRRFF
ncbi:MAG: hypothetical protein J0I06_10955, partial [Planctomycetes bacterium]|nr:hypothetical protein [Planctomycetota bacterium]